MSLARLRLLVVDDHEVVHWGLRSLLGVGYDLANWFNMTDSLDFPSTNIGKPERRTSDLMLEGLSVQVACRVLGVSESGSNAWRKRAPPRERCGTPG